MFSTETARTKPRTRTGRRIRIVSNSISATAKRSSPTPSVKAPTGNRLWKRNMDVVNGERRIIADATYKGRCQAVDNLCKLSERTVATTRKEKGRRKLA